MYWQSLTDRSRVTDTTYDLKEPFKQFFLNLSKISNKFDCWEMQLMISINLFIFIIQTEVWNDYQHRYRIKCNISTAISLQFPPHVYTACKDLIWSTLFTFLVFSTCIFQADVDFCTKTSYLARTKLFPMLAREWERERIYEPKVQDQFIYFCSLIIYTFCYV